MHAIQPSGNTIAKRDADLLPVAAADEIADRARVGELIRQMGPLIIRFQFLAGKFKVAVSGAAARPCGHQKPMISGLQIVEKMAKSAYQVIVVAAIGRPR